jgi:outer membrane lipoprotein carrier protein
MTRKSSIGALLVLLTLPGLSMPLAETPTGAEVVAAQLEQKLRSLKSLEADFDQFYYSVAVASPLHEKGRLYFQKTNLMRWEYTQPEPKVFLYRDDIFSQYYPQDEQLVRSSLAKAQYESEVLTLLAGQKNLAEDYRLELDLSSPEARAAGRLKLTPRVEGEYASITLDLDARTGLIGRAAFLDWAGNRTEFIFGKIKENPPLKPSTFTLTVPPGTEVIEDVRGPVPVKKRSPEAC